MEYAPIALFVYKRLWHTQCTVKSLLSNDIASASELYIFSDGPNDETKMAVAQVRNWLEHIEGFKKVHIIKQTQNLGLAQSIINGVTQLTKQFGKVIVVEDDLMVSPYFLQFMNEGLNVYQNDKEVASIHGYALPIKEAMPETYFLRGADCWGWATWKRAWDYFESDGNKLLTTLSKQKLQNEFDFQGTQPNIQMLKNQIKGKNNSWAIRWHASAFIQKMYTLYPGKSLVRNIGLDNSGEHCTSNLGLEVQLTDKAIELKRLPIEKNQKAYHAYVKYFKSLCEPLYKKISRKIMRVLHD